MKKLGKRWSKLHAVISINDVSVLSFAITHWTDSGESEEYSGNPLQWSEWYTTHRLSFGKECYDCSLRPVRMASLSPVILFQECFPVHDGWWPIRSSILFTRDLLYLSNLLSEPIQYLLVLPLLMAMICWFVITTNRSPVFHHKGELCNTLHSHINVIYILFNTVIWKLLLQVYQVRTVFFHSGEFPSVDHIIPR